MDKKHILLLTTGLSPEIFHARKGLGYKGIVIEAFGLGGMTSEAAMTKLMRALPFAV